MTTEDAPAAVAPTNVSGTSSVGSASSSSGRSGSEGTTRVDAAAQRHLLEEPLPAPGSVTGYRSMSSPAGRSWASSSRDDRAEEPPAHERETTPTVVVRPEASREAVGDMT